MTGTAMKLGFSVGLDAIAVYIAAFQLGYIISRGFITQSHAGRSYRHARFGVFGEFMYFLNLVDTDALQELHWNINVWTDEEILAWKASYLASCNAISVAVRSPSSSVASLTLCRVRSLPPSDSVHFSCPISTRFTGLPEHYAVRAWFWASFP